MTLPIFIISLPYSKERREKTKQILEEQMNWTNYEFIDALDENSEIVQWYSYLCYPKEEILPNESTTNYGDRRPRPTGRVLACFLSHLKALKHVSGMPLEKGNHAIIVEDDVTFHKNFEKFLLENHLFDKDLVRLGYLFYSDSSKSLGVYPCPDALSGGQGYLVTRDYAKYLVDKFDHPIRFIQPRNGIDVTSEALLQPDIDTTKIYIPDDRKNREKVCIVLPFPWIVERPNTLSVIGNGNHQLEHDDEFYYSHKEQEEQIEELLEEQEVPNP